VNQATPVLLAILDGWGIGEKVSSNAIHMAATPNMDRWQQEYPSTTLLAHNGAVGLPEGQMGNSEVGHLNIGAGRVVYQDFTRINKSIRTGEFFDNPVLIEAMNKAKERGSALHLLGLASDGGVHSHLDHLQALVKLAAKMEVRGIYIHAFLDGRDTPPKSGAGYLEKLQTELSRSGAAQVATVIGRYYAMDRDNRWERVQLAWQAMVEGDGNRDEDPVVAVHNAYARGETDEFIKPTVIEKNGRPVALINDGDVIISFNFRADRVRQLTHAFIDPEFDKFACRKRPGLAAYATFTCYDKNFRLPVVFPPVALTHILGEEISRHQLRQLRIAETEKYAHVTYFFNGGRENPFPLEDRCLVPSPQEVATYDQKPEMSAYLVTDQLLAHIENKDYGLVVLNFANGDMVGHSGIFQAAVKACEAVDRCLGRLVAAFTARGGIVIITADHGNAEIMFDHHTAGPHTAHSLNPVPFILISDRHQGRRLRQDGALKDIAPTILHLHGLPVPAEMDGTCLLLTDAPEGRSNR
jgi:2,3-bisphosphoglycerate-independent phosphoglycerate mutase